jgi:hypothetical protein
MNVLGISYICTGTSGLRCTQAGDVDGRGVVEVAQLPRVFFARATASKTPKFGQISPRGLVGQLVPEGCRLYLGQNKKSAECLENFLTGI